MSNPTLEEIRSELSRRSLLKFIQTNEPDYEAGWFHRELCSTLEKFYDDVEAGKCPKIMIFAPPQHGKSTCVSQFLPAWALGKNPKLRFVDASYSSSLAEKNCAITQQLVVNEPYQKIFPGFRIGKNVNSEHELKKKQTNGIFEVVGQPGYYKAVGVGGSLTGFSYDIGLIDDPFKDHAEAYSVVIREAVWNWYSTVFLTRKAPKHGIIIINTRWHADDLCGRLLDQEPDEWTVYNFKAIATEDEKHRKLGEALHPERYPLSQLLSFKEKYPLFFAAMYQGNPVPESGALFKTEMFEFCSMPSEFDYSFVMADTAYRDQAQNDFNVFGAFGVKDEELYLIDVWRKKINASEVEGPAATFVRRFMQHTFRGCYIEPKGHGIYLNQQFPKLGIMVPSESQLKEFYKDRNKNKIERANNAIPYLGIKKIHINEMINEKEELLKEALSFPRAKNDDFVDIIIDAVKLAFAHRVGILDVL